MGAAIELEDIADLPLNNGNKISDKIGELFMTKVARLQDMAVISEPKPEIT